MYRTPKGENAQYDSLDADPAAGLELVQETGESVSSSGASGIGGVGSALLERSQANTPILSCLAVRLRFSCLAQQRWRGEAGSSLQTTESLTLSSFFR